MGLKCPLSCMCLMIWPQEFFFYGPDVLIEFCYLTFMLPDKLMDLLL